MAGGRGNGGKGTERGGDWDLKAKRLCIGAQATWASVGDHVFSGAGGEVFRTVTSSSFALSQNRAFGVAP